MRVLIDKQTGTVLHPGGCYFDGNVLRGDGWIDPSCTPENSFFQDVPDFGPFVSGSWVWNGTTCEKNQYFVEPVIPREQLKAQREAAVAAIKVTTAAGNTFDGDEISQGRMSRAIIALSTGLAPSVTWVLADNTVIQATSDELVEALALAGMAQAAVWVIE
jgi:hypothetical protein